MCALTGLPAIAAQADTFITTITAGSNSTAVAINPAGTFAYTANYGSNTVSKINLSTNAVTAITVGVNPFDITINSAGTFAYVTRLKSLTDYSSGEIVRIDLATDAVTTISTAFAVRNVAINPAGTFAYVTHLASNKVSKIDLTTEAVTDITVGSEPYGVAINPAGTFAYTANYESGTVTKIDLDTNVATTITVGSNPWGVAINPAGTFAYVANSGSGTVSKIDLTTEAVTDITVGSEPRGVAINPAGTFAYVVGQQGIISKISVATDKAALIQLPADAFHVRNVAINSAGTFAYVTQDTTDKVYKVAVTATDQQTITFTTIGRAVVPAPLTQLFGTKSVTVVASASSGFTVSFSSSTPTVCTVSGSTVTMLTVGDCTINANQAGGSGWDAAPQVSRTFTILPSPPPGEPGVSIKSGDSYVNTKQVTLNLVWPEYATGARISNDGGFAASKTQTKNLAASIDWELDDSVKGIYTKVVYVRFNGVADTTKTYSDDIILDTTAPTIETSSAAVASVSVDVSLKASDDITGVDKVEIRNDTQTVTKDYATKVSVPLADLSLSVSSSGVRKLATTAVEIRVSDKAGNWTGWQTVAVAGLTKAPAVTTPAVTTPDVTTPAVTTPDVTTPAVTTTVAPKTIALTVKLSKAASAKWIAAFAKLKVLSTSKVGLKVASSYAKYCKVSGTTLRGIKTGTCKVTVTVTPKKGKVTSKTVTLKVTK